VWEGDFEEGEPRYRSGVVGPGALCDERGGVIEQGIGSASDHVEVLIPS